MKKDKNAWLYANYQHVTSAVFSRLMLRSDMILAGKYAAAHILRVLQNILYFIQF